MTGLQIVGMGRCLPARVVSNEELSRTVDTSDEWITSRTGIKQRYFCETETVTSLAEGAARRAMERAGVSSDQIGVCIVCSFTPECASPSTACMLQSALNLPDIPCFDLNAACTGFLYGLQTARGLLAFSDREYALVIGCEKLSGVTDMTDRNTCVLFGDGAGAAVVRLSSDHPFECELGAQGSKEILWVNGLGEASPAIHMDGQAVFRFATDIIPRCANLLLEKAGLELGDVDWFVCHQANGRIIDSAARKLKAPAEKFYKNIQRYGNTSSASIPIALDEMWEQGLIAAGKKVLCIGFGGGLTWGGALLTL